MFDLLINLLKRKAVVLLTILGISAPLISVKCIDYYYYSFIIGCAAGFVCCSLAFILVLKRPDAEKNRKI
ncbi:hypothetical protein [Bacillus atrophaeus]|uniref:hypothetical protein n=1 Tax=Bacillus atrophaeus TaxID=1452 RepID=UPI000A72E814|nr:hypothetical protein [Bacillus atrophaeus]MCY9110310.1 hypothetical protein [Bacillus atrophaeus]